MTRMKRTMMRTNKMRMKTRWMREKKLKTTKRYPAKGKRMAMKAMVMMTLKRRRRRRMTILKGQQSMIHLTLFIAARTSL